MINLYLYRLETIVHDYNFCNNETDLTSKRRTRIFCVISNLFPSLLQRALLHIVFIPEPHSFLEYTGALVAVTYGSLAVTLHVQALSESSSASAIAYRISSKTSFFSSIHGYNSCCKDFIPCRNSTDEEDGAICSCISLVSRIFFKRRAAFKLSFCFSHRCSISIQVILAFFYFRALVFCFVVADWI
jgi:hypothetical protein